MIVLSWRSGLMVALTLAVLAGCEDDRPTRLVIDSGFVADVIDAGQVDAGVREPVDAGDAGLDAGPVNPSLLCDVGLQNCDGGSCQHYALSDGGFGSRCFEGGCDLVKQDCATGLKCTYSSDGDGGYARGCAPDGDGGEGAGCTGTPTSNSCRRGLICASATQSDGGSGNHCARLCHSTSGCGSPQLCYLVILVPGSEERPLACADPPPTCDPLAQNCARAQDGCYPGSPPSCFPAGNKVTGQACLYTNECLGGSACVGDSSGGSCRPICRFPSGAPACPRGSGCTLLSGETVVGVCL